MNRDHLRLVASGTGPRQTSEMETLSFAQVEGGLVILHNDQRITPSQAVDVLVKMTCLLKALADPARAVNAELKLRHLLPGDMGGLDEDIAEGDAILAISAGAKPFFAQDRHERGYPIERPRPICAETEGDMA